MKGNEKETNPGVSDVQVQKVIFLAAGVSSRPCTSPIIAEC